MKKHILLCVFFSLFLNSMDAPKIVPHNPLAINNWQFFSEPNILDSLGEAISCWDKKSYKTECSIETVAQLHILQHSNLKTKNLNILDVECGKGHTTAFLAENALTTMGCDKNETNLLYAQKQYQRPQFTNPLTAFKENKYDLIIACNPTTHDITQSLSHLKECLRPDGKIFFIAGAHNRPLQVKTILEILLTISNALPNHEQWQLTELKKIALEQYPKPNKTLTDCIRSSHYEIISSTPVIFEILIQDKDLFITYHKSLFAELPFMALIQPTKKREKIINLFMKKIIDQLRKDNETNWFYPIERTTFLLKNIE